MGKALQVVGVVAAHFENADDGAFPFHGAQQVVADAKEMLDLLKDPWIADGSPADHNAINAVSLPVLKGFLRRFDITVTEDGNMDPGVLFYPGDKGPVGLSFV